MPSLASSKQVSLLSRATRMPATERLYYNDTHLIEFEARVIDVTERVSGWTAVVLDRTAFYPTGGGQPSDTGTLNGSRVVECIDDGDRGVLHIVQGLARIEFVAGMRALADYRKANRSARDVAALFSTGRDDVPQHASQLVEENKELHRQVRALGEVATGVEAERLLSSALVRAD